MSAIILGFPHRKAASRRRQIRQKVISSNGTLGDVLDPGGQLPRRPAYSSPDAINLRAVDPDEGRHPLVSEPLLQNPIGEHHDPKGVSDTRVCQAQCASGGIDDEMACAQDAHMAGKRAIKPKPKVPDRPPAKLTRIQLKAWRELRNLTQDDVAPIAGIERSQASRIENAKSPYSQHHLERLAIFYQCQPWQLLVQDPTDKSWAYKFLSDMPEQTRDELIDAATDIAKVLRKKLT